MTLANESRKAILLHMLNLPPKNGYVCGTPTVQKKHTKHDFPLFHDIYIVYYI